ncbi:MAG TPA: phytase [Croceibacterium sp.]
MRGVATVALAVSLSACATPTPQGLPPVSVTAQAETEPVGTAAQDAADDPAIWRNAADPASSLIVATDKKAGLYVYGLDGSTKSFVEGGLLNNVDLVDMGAAGIVVVASDRNDLANAMLQVYRLDPRTAALTLLGKVPGGTGEGYGLCLRKAGDRLLAYSALKDGTVQEVEIALGAAPSGALLRQMKIPTQIEGCVADPADGTLYVGEEKAGIWRFAPGATEGELVARVDNQHLVADVEGLAILREGDRALLVASSQGDNAYAVFALPALTPLGRFAITAGAFGAAEETDGIELVGGSFGSHFPDGLFVAQDGHNQPHAQNFKLVSWAAIKAALGID